MWLARCWYSPQGWSHRDEKETTALHNEAAGPVGKSKRATFSMVVNFRLGFAPCYILLTWHWAAKRPGPSLQVYTPQAIFWLNNARVTITFSHTHSEIAPDCLPQQSVALSCVCDTASHSLYRMSVCVLSLRENDIQLAEPIDEGQIGVQIIYR